MQFLLALLALVAGLLLVAAALVYPVDALQGQRLLQQLRVVFILLLVIIAASAVIHTTDVCALVIGLLLTSVAAYIIRELRNPKRGKKQVSIGGAERTPVLPVVDESEKKESDEQ
jgi:Ca2+/Na+ antiporter